MNKNEKKGLSLQVTFLGVRGTAPTISPEFMKYGGNTPCVYIKHVQDDSCAEILLDAGTGIISHSSAQVEKGAKEFHLLFSHYHYDHIFGLIKFAPLFKSDCTIHVYGPSYLGQTLKDMFSRFFSYPFFPLKLEQLPAYKNIHFHNVKEKTSFKIKHLVIATQPLNHPQGALSYKIQNERERVSVVYATDHEQGSSRDEELKLFMKGTDLFIYDSSYSSRTYQKHQGWGHSTSEVGAQFSKEANVKRYAIFHHEPNHDDTFLENTILKEALAVFEGSFLSYEGLCVTL